MKIERLKQKSKKPIIIGVILTVVIGGALTYKLTHSKYRVTQSIDLGSGTINYKVPDFKIMAMYKSEDGKNYTEMASTERMPGSGYVIDESKSYCNLNGSKDTTAVLKTVSGNHVVSNLIKGDKCYLYFKKGGKSIDNIIATIKASSSYKGTATPAFNTIAQGAETEANNGIYATTDGTNMYSGTTYYWRGGATTNHVIFANKCWRIVRINGDKTMRLIYNGPIIDSNKCTGNGANADAVYFPNNDNTDSSINLNRYATSDGQYNNPSYVGWKYELSSPRPASTTSGTDSNAKVQTQKWYDSNIGNNPTYSAKVAEGKFCNDREIGSGSWTTSNTAFYYAGYTRLNTNKAPTFNCSNANDVYTLKVGAITADEVAFAGGVYGTSNSSYYMYTGKYYWTMSPFNWNGAARVFVVDSGGSLSADNVSNAGSGLRPVINLKSDTTFASGGTGQNSNPYVVS